MIFANVPPLAPPPMSRSSSSSTITLTPSTPPCPKFADSPIHQAVADAKGVESIGLFDQVMPVTLPKCLDLSAVKVTKPIKALLSKSLSQLDRPLSLVGLLATEDTGCHMYADMTQRACKAADVNFSKLDLTHLRKASNEKAAFDELCTVIERLNKDTTVDGLIVYFPLFTPELDAYLRDLIDPRIDVEGVNPTSLTISCYDAPDLVEEVTANPSRGIVYPCTALAVFRSLQSPEVALYNPALPKGERLRGKTITVLNRSDAVGRPLAVMLANDGARVLSVDINTTLIVQRLPGMQGHIASSYPEEPSLGFLIEQSDAVISAVPGKNFKVPTASLHQGTVCIDLSEHGNFEDDVRARAGVFAPRLGSVTILMLKMNALILRSRAMAEVANTNA